MPDRHSPRAVLYARKSTKDDDSSEQSKSVADQLRDLAIYAERNGMAVVAEFKDDGLSGLLGRDRRPGLDKTLRLIESGDADVLLTWWSSRLSRRIQDQSSYLAILAENGVAWHCPAEGGEVLYTTAMEKAFTNQRALWNEFTSDQIRDNWRDAHRRRIERGLPKTSSPQFGYDYIAHVDERTGRRIKDTGQYVINEAEAVVVKEVYRRYLRGDGFTSLVVWLNEAGWKVKSTGNKWTVRTLNRWMDAGFAAGFISREADLREGNRGRHEVLISEDQWLAYEAARKQRAVLGKGNGSAERWWLAGFVRCGECGGPTYIGGPSVCCSTHRADPTSCTGGKSILRAYVENAIGWWLGQHIEHLEQLVGHEANDGKDAAVEAWKAARAKVDKIEAAIGKANAERLLSDGDPAEYDATLRHLRGLLAEAKQEREIAATAMQQEASPDLGLLRHGATWDADRRAALAGVLHRVEVYPGGITVYPVTGGGVSFWRRAMHPRCRISGCDNRERSRGICTSHSMRARNIGGQPLLDLLAERVAESMDEDSYAPVLTVDEVEAIFENATG